MRALGVHFARQAKAKKAGQQIAVGAESIYSSILASLALCQLTRLLATINDFDETSVLSG
jgi:hypothetical protein